MKKLPPPPAHDSASIRSESGVGRDAVAWALGAGKGDELVRQIEASVKRTRRRRAAMTTACVVVVLALGSVWQHRQRGAPDPAAGVSRGFAIVSLPAKQVLPDGSVVELKEVAGISVEFSAGVRRVRLQNGEAHFQVTQDVARPFVVVASGVEVRALGTAFSVQLGAHAVEVLVTEGRVAVDKSSAPAAAGPAARASEEARPGPLAVVESGNRVVVNIAAEPEGASPPVVPVSEEELVDRLAWRVPRLEFSGTPLAEVIPIFNQLSRTRIVLDPALGELEISGILRGDNTASLLRLLKNEFGIEAETRGNGEVHLLRP